jgi:hypothetical protein
MGAMKNEEMDTVECGHIIRRSDCGGLASTGKITANSPAEA